MTARTSVVAVRKVRTNPTRREHGQEARMFTLLLNIRGKKKNCCRVERIVTRSGVTVCSVHRFDESSMVFYSEHDMAL